MSLTPPAPPSSRRLLPTAPAVGAASFGGILGVSQAIRELIVLLDRLAATDTSVLLTGETGTGKTLAAQELRSHSSRSEAPLLVVDCSCEPAEVEAYLFGNTTVSGAIDRAAGGTLLLDNVNTIPVGLQGRLLEMLRERNLDRQRHSRLLATSREPLALQVARGMLRKDLAALVGVVTLDLPPLRRRPDDIPILAADFLERAQAERSPAQRTTLGPAVLRSLTAHDWPGNVRELKQWVLRLGVGMPRGLSLSSADSASDFDPNQSYGATRRTFEAAFEQRYVAWLLRRHQGNVSAAARAARMDRKHLYELAKRHDLRFVAG